MRVTVIGAGAGGAAAVAELTQAGHEVRLWNRSAETLAPFERAGGVEYEGVLGAGLARPEIITTNLREALEGSDVVICTLPTFSHAAVARSLAACDLPRHVPVVLNPGHTGGALEFRTAYEASGKAAPPIAEFSTLTYVARNDEEMGRFDMSAIELSDWAIWPSHITRSDMVEKTGQRIDIQ